MNRPNRPSNAGEWVGYYLGEPDERGRAVVESIVDRALAQYTEATAVLAEIQPRVKTEGRRRAEALAVLYDTGLTLKQIGKLVGISSPRVGQMIASLGRKVGQGEGT